MPALPESHPILSCAETADLEARLLGGDEALQWAAMLRAGAGVAEAVLADFSEAGDFPGKGRILVLAGKGNNGGDALIAAEAILRRHPEARASVVFAHGERNLRPQARRAWLQLAHAAGERATALDAAAATRSYDISLDGVYGYSFRPPLDRPAARVLAWANRLPVRLRAAVDLPSGIDDRHAFKADFTYATGVVKTPVLACANTGRLRYIDLGFFEGKGGTQVPPAADRVLTAGVVAPLGALRPARSDKRSYGHLSLFGGSRDYPGAILMAVLSALRSGAGRVTACVPASLAPAFAARAPEAMWFGWPETEGGGLAPGSKAVLLARLKTADAVVVGPGMGRNPETLALAAAIVRAAKAPVLVDADALQPEVIAAARARLVLTPHAGEFARIAGGADLRTYAVKTGATVILKGPVTRICAGAPKRGWEAPVYHSLFGGPVLARGGSGDLLAGLTGGLLAQTPGDPLLAACRGAVWHGRAADRLARARGQVAVTAVQLLEFLPQALRDSGRVD